jgi:hypothetical protein
LIKIKYLKAETINNIRLTVHPVRAPASPGIDESWLAIAMWKPGANPAWTGPLGSGGRGRHGIGPVFPAPVGGLKPPILNQ